jgi:hypothetical protein|tara:strand:- start:599 stop:814 length:216 start_codon:yes stop_codon:yes gene_type:complete
METLVIDGEEIEIANLGHEGQALVNRLVELKNQLGQAELQQQELHLLVNAYASSIKNSLQSVENEQDEQVN